MNLAVTAPPWLAAVFAALLVLAALEDMWRLKISNWTCAAVMVAAFVAMGLAGPTVGLWQNFVIFAVLLAAGMLLFSYNMMGGGDVKLFAAAGLWFDLSGAGRMIVAVLIAGGIVTIFVLMLRLIKWSKGAREHIVILRPKSGIPYGVAIAGGALLTIAMGRA